MNAVELLTELRAASIRVIEPRPNGNLYLAPKARLTPELIERVRAAKAALLAHLRAEQDRTTAAEALALLQRLKTFILPAGRMPAARAIAERLLPLLAVPELDPAETLAALRAVEAKLIELGGACDPELADAIGVVSRTFPGARLVS